MNAAPPIRHVVIVVKENHAFDNYFGRFPGADGAAGLAHAANPPTQDPDHRHSAWLVRDQRAPREQYDRPDIPGYWALAEQYTLCDRYFTDVAGPSTPNHLMLIAASSPIVDNPHRYRQPNNVTFKLPSLPQQLAAARLEWRNYNGYAFDYIEGLSGRKLPAAQFAQDAAAGNLPAVSWLYADHPLSEHPPDPQDAGKDVGNVTKGMAWTVQQVQAVVRGGLWPQVAIFITWDDWGGWYDHVAPPELEQVKDAVPSAPNDATQFRYGSRVPCLVVSPYARKGHISNTVLSHASIVRFCEQQFALPSLNSRTANADPMSDCFDFTQAPLPAPVV